MASRSRQIRGSLRALPWISPAIVLIVTIVLFPVVYMGYSSTRDLSPYGVDRGGAGLGNFEQLFSIEALPRVLLNTGIWVFVVVTLTLLLSLMLAQFLNKDFPWRRSIRLAILVPWAASVVMTTTVFYYLLDPDVGIVNKLLVDLHLLDDEFGFTKQPVPAFIVAIGVAVFVSIPFTTYTLLAGLQTIPDDVMEAAQVDGTTPWQRYRHIVLPQLKSAIAVAVIINMINVFNSLPILQIITGSISGNKADTTTTLTFKLIRQNQQVDTAAAMSILNFVLIVGIIAVYLRVVRPMRED